MIPMGRVHHKVSALLFVAFAIIIALIGFYFLGRGLGPATNQTYANEEYGFQFEYPSGWNLVSAGFPVPGSESSDAPNYIDPFLVEIEEGGGRYISASFKKRSCWGTAEPAGTKIEDVSTEGYAGAIYKSECTEFCDPNISLGYIVNVCNTGEGACFGLRVHGSPDEDLSLLKQISDTLVFTDQFDQLQCSNVKG